MNSRYVKTNSYICENKKNSRTLKRFIFWFVLLQSVIANKVFCQTEPDLLMSNMNYPLSEEETNEVETLYEQKFPINTAPFSEYSRLFFLSEFQRKSLYDYVQKHKPVRTAYEFLYVLGFTEQTAHITAAFCTFEAFTYTPTFSDFTGKGTHSFSTLNSWIPVSETDYRETLGYPGKALQTTHRYRYSAYDRLSWGVTARNDMGESQQQGPFSHSFDYSSAYVQYQSESYLSNIVVGDYQVSVGQGLAYKQGGFFSKSMGYSPFNSQHSLKAHSSSNQFSFNRGVGATVSLQNFAVTPFYSRKKIDGYRRDSSYAFPFMIYSTGSHRTAREIICKDNILHSVWGINTSYSMHESSIGTAFIRQQLSDTAQYHFSHASLHGTYRNNNSSIYGETAIDSKSHMAHMYGLSHTFSSYVNMNVLFRSYDNNFESFSSKGFSEQSTTGNELGVYTDVTAYVGGNHSITLAHDRFATQYANVRNETIRGHESLLTWEYTKYNTYSFRSKTTYSRKQKQNEHFFYETSAIITKNVKQEYRLSVFLHPFEFRSTISGGLSIQDSIREKGYYIGNDIIFRIPQKITCYMRYAHFNAPYNARIYVYQNAIRYAYASPQVLYNGNMFSGICKYSITANFQIQFQMYFYFYKTPQSELPAQYILFGKNRKKQFALLVLYRW